MPVALHSLPAPAAGRPTRAALAAGTTFGLAVVLLVLAFLLVVQQAVRQGETRRRTTALLAEATWRCKALRDRSERESCLAHLRTMPEDDAGLRRLLVAMTTAGPAARP
jgi:Na+-transporting methylmalonyl-CoA/oxaloacetate decarboxylase gamma subunit